MAKGKHSTALFEVIHSKGAANKPGRIAQSLRTPKWWFKSGHSSPVTTPAPAPVFDEPEPPASEPAARTAYAPARPTSSRGDRSSGVQLGFDRGRQEVTLRLRYTTVLVGGFAVCAVIGLSYVLGRHLGAGPRTAGAEQASVTQLLAEPPQPGVTAVKPKPPTPRVQAPHTVDAPRHTVLAANSGAPKQNVVPSLVPASADTTMPRKVGLNYLIISAYPGDRLSSAEAARDYFTRSGIPCTIEKTGWTLGNWVTLIGTAGFTRVKTDDFKGYVERAAALAKTYKTANFDRPEPSMGYQWRATDEKSN